jgi:hypothetical protein
MGLLRVEIDPLCAPPAGVLLTLGLLVVLAWTYAMEWKARR